MGNMSGVVGSGIGALVRTYMDEKHHQDTLDQQKRLNDRADREEKVKNFSLGIESGSGLLSQPVTPPQSTQPPPPEPEQGILAGPVKAEYGILGGVAPSQPKGHIPYPGDQTSQDLSGKSEFQFNPTQGILAEPKPQPAPQAQPVQQAQQAPVQSTGSSDYHFAPWRQKQIDLEQSKTQSSLDELNPGSDKVKAARDTLRKVLNDFKPGSGDKYITDAMTIPQMNDVITHMEKFEGINVAKLKAITQGEMARAMAGYRNDRLDETKNQNAAKAGNAFEATPIIALGKKTDNMLKRSSSILDNPNKPVVKNDLNLAYQDYINSVDAAGNATEGKIRRELPESWAIDWNGLKSKAGDFDDLRKSTTGKQLIDMLKENIRKVRQDIREATEEQAYNVHQSYTANTNPKVKDTIKEKLKMYAPNKYNEIYGGGKASPSPAPSQGLISQPRHVSDDEISAYAAKYKMTPDEAKNSLRSQGYGTN